MANVFILLGGNVGDKSKIFNLTISHITNKIGRISQISSIYATESWGFKSDLFWNQLLIVDTQQGPFEVLEHTQSIEKELGRTKKGGNYENRTIDLDILYYDDLILSTPDLIIPHPQIARRKFALAPLDEIAPDKIDPVLSLTIHEMLALCEDSLTVEKISNQS
jgi:2-amino-4-hydroxy-6-hydroxymethyldihydropteridine diphosphokinase